MKLSDLISLAYPASDYTNPSNLQLSLGSFWNLVFKERTTLIGYTTGMSEELLQAYDDIVDVVNSYGINNIPLLKKIRWYPLVVKASTYDQAPLVFEPNDSYFGPQPSTDQFYANQVFNFGFPKTPNNNAFVAPVDSSFTKFFFICNRVMSPSRVYVNGVDVVLQNQALYFNSDFFNDPTNIKYDIVNENGVNSTYVNSAGQTVNDQYIVLWVYQGEIDQSNLATHFGYIYDLILPSVESSRAIIKGLMNLAIGSPTIKYVKSAVAAFADIPVVIEDGEIVEYIATNDYNLVVATNLNVYKFNLQMTLLPSVIVGAVVNAGDILVDAIQYFDSGISPGWWKKVFAQQPSIPLSSSIFLGNYEFQLFFSNTIDYVTLSEDNVLNFPVIGRPNDVQTFQNYINQPENLAALLPLFGLNNSTTPADHVAAVPIVPSDFLFSNFFQDNMALFQVSLYDVQSTSNFLNYFSLLRGLLPPTVYIMISLNLSLTEDVYDNLNDCYYIPALNATFSADGGDANGNIADEAPYYYTNVPIRLFALSKSPLRLGQLLTGPSNLDVVSCNGNTNFILDRLNVPFNYAYSLRRLTKNYEGPYIDVRRDSDNTVQSFGLNSQNEIDRVAILAFCGAANGFIVRWYDATGNGRHVIQETLADQPQIVTAGVININGIKPCTNFNGSSTVLTGSTVDAPNTNWSLSAISSSSSENYQSTLISTGPVFDNGIFIYSSSGYPLLRIQFSPSGQFVNVSFNPIINIPFILTCVYDSSNDLSVFTNGINTANATISGYTAGTLIEIGNNSYGQYFLGSVQEIISFSEILIPSIRLMLETDQANFYGISGLSGGGQCLVKAANMFTRIPTGATNGTIQQLQIMDFS